MSDSISNLPTAADSAASGELAGELASLRSAVVFLSFLLLAVTLTAAGSIWWLGRQQQLELTRGAPTYEKVQKEVQRMQLVVAEFQDFAVQDPGFAPALARLGLRPQAKPGSALQVPAPAPAPAPKK